MSDSPIQRAVERLIEAVNARLAKQEAEVRNWQKTGDADLRRIQEEWRARYEQQRSAVVTSPMDVVDMQEIITRAAARVPVPKDGKDGADGKDAVVDTESIIARVTDSVMVRVLEKIPTPERGEKGESGPPGPPGPPGTDGSRGEDGLSAPEEMLEFLRCAVVEYSENWHRGVYGMETEYKKGDGATWGGSTWIATRASKGIRPGTDDNWRLIVKAGRDGKR